MNRKGSFRKGSSLHDLGRKSSKSVGSHHLSRLSKVCLGSLSSGETPGKPLMTPQHNKASHLSGPLMGSIKRLSCRSSGLGVSSKKAPWNPTDPTFKSQCIDKILDFLLANEMDYNITRNILKAPTAKDFINIFTFIYKFWDPLFKLKKMEEQIPKLMKALGFPGHLTKSTFLNVGSPHSWPPVLAMLAWLCDMSCCSDIDVQDMFIKDFESEKNVVELKLNVITACYISQGDTSNLIEDFRVELEMMKSVRTEDFENAVSTHDEQYAKLKEVPDKEEELAEIKDKYCKLQLDYDKLIEYEEKIILVINEKTEDTVNLDNQYQQITNNIDEIQENIDNIKEQQEKQGQSEEEIQEIKSYKHKYIASMEYYKTEEDDLKQKQWKIETEVSKLRMNTWSTLVCEFASHCRQIAFDSSFLSNGDLESYNVNKDEVVKKMRTTLGSLVSENVMLADKIEYLSKEIDQDSDKFIAVKKKLTQLEKKAAELTKEKNKINKENKIENDRQQNEIDELSDNIAKTKRHSEINYNKQSQLSAITKEYKSLIEKGVKAQEEGKVIITKKRSNVDWFLLQKAEMNSRYQKSMLTMVQKMNEDLK